MLDTPDVEVLSTARADSKPLDTTCNEPAAAIHMVKHNIYSLYLCDIICISLMYKLQLLAAHDMFVIFCESTEYDADVMILHKGINMQRGCLGLFTMIS